MLTLTPSAVEAVDELLHSNPTIPAEAGLRIAATSETELSLGIAAAPAPDDQIIEQSGARVFVESATAPLVDDAELDARKEGDRVAFGLAPQGGGGALVGADNGTGPE